MLAALLPLISAVSAHGLPRFCSESPVQAAAASVGRASNGAIQGAVKLESDALVRVLPHQAERCLDWGTPRLIAAIRHAAEAVMSALPGSSPLGVGDLSRARGGPIHPYSRSHQSGRDADLAYFQADASGEPIAASEFVRFDSSLKGLTGQGERRVFDVERNWQLVRALLTDAAIRVRWLFVSNRIRAALLDEAKREGAPEPLLARAAEALHQPSDSAPHDDHLHLRIACEPDEVRCRD